MEKSGVFMEDDFTRKKKGKGDHTKMWHEKVKVNGDCMTLMGWKLIKVSKIFFNGMREDEWEDEEKRETAETVKYKNKKKKMKMLWICINN